MLSPEDFILHSLGGAISILFLITATGFFSASYFPPTREDYLPRPDRVVTEMGWKDTGTGIYKKCDGKNLVYATFDEDHHITLSKSVPEFPGCKSTEDK